MFLRWARKRGFTLIEFMISVALLSILILLGLPGFVNWIQNTKIRTVAEGLANGLRLSQVEATRQSRSVQFVITNQPGLDAPPANNGLNWSAQIIPLPGETVADRTQLLIQSSQLSGANSGVQMSAVTPKIIFNSVGRLSNPNGPPPVVTTYDITYTNNPSGSRPLRVLVTPAGQVRVCDPVFTLSDSAPTGCPAP